MPVLTTYPGVYVEEIPSGVHTITGVATSITAFVGRALCGPVNVQTPITSYADYERIFGGLWQQSPMSFAVQDFFLNGGSQAVIVRVFNGTIPAAAPQPASSDAGVAAILAAAADAQTAAASTTADVVNAANAALGANASALAQQAVADGRSSAAAAGATPQTVADAISKTASDANAAAVKTAVDNAAKAAGAKPADVAKAGRDAVTAGSTAGDAVAKAGETAAAAAGATAQSVADAVDGAASTDAASAAANAAQAAAARGTPAGIVATATAAAGNAPSDAAKGVLAKAQDAVKNKTDVMAAILDAASAPLPAGNAPAPTAAAQIALPGGLTLEASSEGAWGANLRARIDPLATAPGLTADQRTQIAADLGVAPTDVFTLTVHENGGATEQFANVTVVASPRKLDAVLLASQLVRASGQLPVKAPSGTPGAVPKVDPWPNDGSSVGATGGSDGGSVGSTEILGGLNGEAQKAGLYALNDADLFNLLVIPTPIDGGDAAYLTVVGTAVPYCENHRAVMIVDPPQSWTSVNVIIDPSQAPGQAPLAGTASDHAAVFWPRIQKANPLHKNMVEQFSASGAIAGIFAQTDTQRGVWKAPAGLQATIAGIVALDLPMNDLENGELNTRGVNCLRTKPAVGPVVWGARTRAGDDRLTSEWKYIPVRRTALFLEESLFRGTQWVVFEPNDEPLWSQIRLNIGAFMHTLFLQGAFQGATPKDAYFVKCDDETTTQNDIDNGTVNIVVGFAPLKPAEFVVLQIQQIAGQIQT